MKGEGERNVTVEEGRMHMKVNRLEEAEDQGRWK